MNAIMRGIHNPIEGRSPVMSLAKVPALSLVLAIAFSSPLQAGLICHPGNDGCCYYFPSTCTINIPSQSLWVRPGQIVKIKTKSFINYCTFQTHGCELSPDSFNLCTLIGHSFDGWISTNTIMISPSASGGSNPTAFGKWATSICTNGGRITDCVSFGAGFNVLSNDTPGPDRCGRGDPVDPFLGYLGSTEQDYSVPDRGLSFDLSRSYWSGQDEDLGRPDSTLWRYPLGQGWTHAYNLYVDPEWPLGITIDTLGHQNGGGYSSKVDTVVFHDERGMSWLFQKASTDSIYQTPAGRNYQLRRIGSRWTLYREDGTVCKFNSSGRLDTLDGRNGNKMAFTYDNKNNLSTVRSPSGKYYYFKYYYALGDSHRLRKVYETSDTTSGPFFEYKYRMTSVDSFRTGADSTWRYQLTEIFHHTGGAQDQVELMHRYYYSSERFLIESVRPDTGYGGADTSYANGISTGDRLQCWYDTTGLGRVTYQEEADRNSYLVSQAFLSYYDNSSFHYWPDSTKIFSYKSASGGTAHSVTDTSFHPSAPTSNYFVEKIKWWDSDGKRGVPAWINVKDSTTGDSTVTTFARYNSNFKADSVIGPRGEVTVYTFQTDSISGQPKRYFNLPKKIKYSTTDSVLNYYSKKNNHPVFFQPDSTKDENGYLRKFYYDTNGNDTVVVDTNRVLADSITSNPQTLRTRFGYTKGNRVRVTDPKETHTYFNFGTGDSAAFPTQTWIDMDTSGGGSPNANDIVTKYWYNTNRGLLDSMCYYQDYTTGAGANPIKVRYKYDPLNHLKTVTYPDSAVDSLIYDKRGNVLEKWMAKSGTNYWNTQYSYDALDHLTQVVERANNLGVLGPPTIYYTTKYIYNLNGELSEFRSAHSGMSIYSTYYDYSMGRLIRVRFSDGTNDSLGYYADGSLMYRRSRKSQVTKYEYDNNCSPCGRGRLTKKRYFASADTSVAASDFVRYAYDRVGDLIKVVWNGPSTLDSTLYAYDELYRLKQDSTIGLGRVIKYEYDKNGNRQRMQVLNNSNGAVRFYQSYPLWDRANRDTTTAVKVGANVYTWRMQYYDTGPLKRILYPYISTALKERYFLNSRNFITMVTDTFGASTLRFRNIYAYNPVGDRSSDSLLCTKPAGGTVQGKIRWNYDNIRRLAATRYPASITGGDSAIYAYDAMGNRTSKVSGGGTTSYSYNLNNNELTSNGGSYQYDANGNVIQRAMPNLSEYVYAYDFENRLTKAKYTFMASDSVTYEYDGLGKRTRKVGLTDTTRNTWDGLYPVVEWNNQGKLKQAFIYTNGLLLGLIDSTLYTNRRFFVLHDGLGSSICMTNDSARIVRSFIYSDFGERLVDETAANTPSLNRLYAGYPWDGSPANFYWMDFRQTYDPTIGRFSQEDPVEVNKYAPRDYNLFIYGVDNPTSYFDPTGGWAKGYATASDCSCDPDEQAYIQQSIDDIVKWQTRRTGITKCPGDEPPGHTDCNYNRKTRKWEGVAHIRPVKFVDGKPECSSYCTVKCVEAHEAVHVKRCNEKGWRYYLDLRREEEAYQAQKECLENLLNGK